MATSSFTPKTFPGVYTQITDKSFFTPRTSRFKPGLIGVASKGPFNTPTVVQSLREFVETFGNPIATSYTTSDSDGLVRPDDNGYFLADAVDAVADYTNAITIVRIGKTFTAFADEDGIGTVGSSTLNTALNATRIQALAQGGTPVYLSIEQSGAASTVNALVTQAGGGTVLLDSSVEVLAATYTSAQISYSVGVQAAHEAEGVLYCYSYGTNSGQLIDAPITAVGAVTGDKNNYEFEVAANVTTITPGAIYKIEQSGKNTTHEVRVASVMANADTSGTVFLEKVSSQQIGYQALPLQDNYDNAVLYKATGKQPFAYLKAASEGTWANGGSSANGLFTKVRPGSNPGTKKLEVFWNSALSETHDNLSDDAADTVNFWDVRLARGISRYVYIEYCAKIGQNWTAANTAAPWDSRFYVAGQPVGMPMAMPTGAINAGKLTINGVSTDTGGQFNKGFNGENASDADWIGTLDPVTDKLSGIKAFENRRTVDVNVIAAPMDNISLAVMSQLADTCNKINAVSAIDVPAGLNGRQAIDWHNGHLSTQISQGRLDSKNVGCFWNWAQRSNRFSETKLCPPTIFWLGRAGYTFNNFAPWYAIAGETRGYVQDAQLVQFDEVSDDTLQAMYGNGNSVNPIINIQNRFYIYGERTMQRAESKLTAMHSVICVNWVVNGMAAVARRFVFDPNDAELLDNLNLAFMEFLERIKNDRGLELYELSVSATAENRNNREVIVDIALIPTDVAERIYINATVYESGATINSIS